MLGKKAFMNYELIQKNIADAYRKIASLFSKATGSHNHDHDFIQKFGNLFAKRSRLLDVGCGTGEIAFQLSETFGVDVAAIDISDDMIALAQKNYPAIFFQNMDVCDIGFEDESFDGVFGYFVLIHVPKDKIPKAFSEIKRVLKDGGYVFVTIQEAGGEKAVEGLHTVPYDTETQLFLNVMSEQEILGYLNNAGFKVIDTYSRKPEQNEFPFNKFSVIAQK
jgi:ubiquinone/menaquinone biosynthesis C-methylase UbiE